jgi:hypothetical protein
MTDPLVYVIIAAVAIAGAAAWLYLPKREPQVRDGQGSRHHRPGSLALSRRKENPGRHIPGHTLNVDGGFGATGLMFAFDPQKSRSLGAKGE